MDSEPTTPVRVPKAVSTYTPTTQDPDLRSQINTVLLRDGHISKIQETLIHALHASPTNWPTVIQDHALALLRSGEISTFPALMSRVLEDIREDSIAARQREGQTNGANGNSKTGEKGGGKGKGQNGVSLALPKSVVEEGVKITRECLELVCEVGHE
ncbi:Uncharacterized protein BP5553_04014 [Venustampulla echinocandica]|uniref:Uncharacterized protein n=1 Tax=Venustampulla echinocandica TaxID=2656787 RepID=A0A370TVW9_9HELO|nr:Uncharacterized protein BP5553_04014 [Venustampulla echinocandica]RDL39674.1 Uncharacterized protein BP5553_04014 [Venustampulla echinocandica]